MDNFFGKRNVNTNRIYAMGKSMIDTITIIGLIAAAFTTLALFPQLFKVWKTKSTKDISTEMFILYCGGVLLWFIYGVDLKKSANYSGKFVSIYPSNDNSVI
jgi:uncharacterized protein with PQ loop repeat